MDGIAPRSGVVLGASAGIGAAIVTRLAEPGLRLHAASRRGSCPSGATGVVAAEVDVRSYASVLALLRGAATAGGIEFVVNSAGMGAYAPLGADRAAAWREIVETNLLGAVHVCSALLEEGIEVGHLVQIGSVAAYRISRTPGNAVYSAAKTAAAVILQHARAELRERGSRTRVSTVAPGFVEGTEFAERYFADAPAAARPLYEDGANLTPAEVADVVAYVLATPPGVDVTELVVRPVAQAE